MALPFGRELLSGLAPPEEPYIYEMWPASMVIVIPALQCAYPCALLPSARGQVTLV